MSQIYLKNKIHCSRSSNVHQLYSIFAEASPCATGISKHTAICYHWQNALLSCTIQNKPDV